MTARLLAILAFFHCVIVQADSIQLTDLGDLQLEYQVARPAQQFRGRPLAALATFRPGDAVSLVAPYRVRQIHYQQMPGAQVEAGDIIARLSGPEVHHFVTEFDVIKARFEAAQSRFKRNRQLYESQAIDESRWLAISESYYALQLEYERRQHFYDLLEETDDKDAMWLKAPVAGLLDYAAELPGVNAGQELAIIVPADARRLRVLVPQEEKDQLRSLAFGQCQLRIEAVSGVVRNFFVEAWSEALTGSCDVAPGARRMVTPIYAAQGYQIPQSAVFQWQGDLVVLINVDQSLQTVPLEIRASEDDSYFIAVEEDIAGREVLVTSVSAVQGVLLGLGGE